MDEAFWSNVVKRWSEASETVIKLKKELSKAHEERELYRDVVHNLRKAGSMGEASGPRLRPPGSGHTRHESGRTIVEEENASSLRDELKDAEAGLGRAKEEYRRLQKELTQTTERIQALTAENAELLSLQRQEIAAVHDERQQMLKLHKELEESRLENQRLLDKVRQLEQEMARTYEISDRGLSDRTPTISSVRPATLKSVERQIELLKESLQSKEAENDELRNELEIAEEKFHKAEERNKTMMKSIVKLQDITRHSTSSLRTLSPNLLASSPRSRKVSLMSNSNRSGILEGVENTKRISASSAAVTVEDVTIVGSHTGNLQSPYSALPEEREKALTKLPIAVVEDVTSNNSFDREFLKNVLGSLVERSSEKQGSTDKKPSTISYLCPTLNHHPWCPMLPGEHGYIFVGLGKEKETYKTPVIRNLFVGLPKDQTRQRRFRYLGKYKVVRVRPLSLEEWNSLPSDTKLMYARLTKEKTKENHPAEEILESYNRGDVSVPCVMLQHLSFDEQLFETLISQRDAGR